MINFILGFLVGVVALMAFRVILYNIEKNIKNKWLN